MHSRTVVPRFTALVAVLILVLAASFSIALAASFTEQKLTAGDAAAGDQFGRSVGISGDTMVVGADLDDDNATSTGSAYVFVRSGSTWPEQQKITASDAAEGDEFGEFVAVSEDHLVVGSPQDDDAGASSGSAYMYLRTGSTWDDEQKITASDAAAGDEFGASVAIDGETAVVGAPLADLGADAGAAYVFVLSGGSWTQQAKLTAGDPAVNDQFGTSVAIDGDTVVVG